MYSAQHWICLYPNISSVSSSVKVVNDIFQGFVFYVSSLNIYMSLNVYWVMGRAFKYPPVLGSHLSELQEMCLQLPQGSSHSAKGKHLF